MNQCTVCRGPRGFVVGDFCHDCAVDYALSARERRDHAIDTVARWTIVASLTLLASVVVWRWC